MRLVYIIPGKIARKNYVYRHGKSRIFRRFSAKFFHFLKRLFDEHKRKTPAGTRFCAHRSLLTQDEDFLWKSQKNLRGFYRFSTKSITAAGYRGGSGVCRRSGSASLSVRKDGPPQAEPAAVNVNTVWGRGALSAGPRSFQRRTRSAAGAGPASAPCWRPGTAPGTPVPRSARPGWPPRCGAARPRCRC